MKRTLILAAVLAMAFGSIADAKSCRDAKGKLTRCPPAGSTLAVDRGHALAVDRQHDLAVTVAPHCKKGKPCGRSCIAVSKVCHK
jgi:hypothetical protein